MHLAIHDAVNAAKSRYEAYLPKVEAPVGTSAEAAALSAAFNALVALYPTQRPIFEAAYNRDLAKLKINEAAEPEITIVQLPWIGLRKQASIRPHRQIESRRAVPMRSLKLTSSIDDPSIGSYSFNDQPDGC